MNWILKVEVGYYFDVNSYFYVDEKTLHGFLIDPGEEAQKLLKICADKNFVIEKILITHGHFDHIGAVNEIQKKLKIPAVMHEEGKIYATNPAWNYSDDFDEPIILNDVIFLPDHSKISVEGNPNFYVELIHTPGHTKDGAIYYSEQDEIAFVGDTIFKQSYGRTDLLGGDTKTLFKSIREKILTLPDKTVLYSGHTAATSVGAEKIFF